jgi:tRNA (guanine-N7-)-methyltransferase
VRPGRRHAAVADAGGTTPDDATDGGKRLLFYGRRHGRKLRPGRQRLMDELLPRLAIPAPAEGRIDPFALFPSRPRALWLEIGFGGGEHLAVQAARHPEIGVLGSEVFVNGIATLLAAIEHERLGNIRIWPEDARLLLDTLPDACLERVFLLFPDPWPKRRHADRRFIGPDNLARLARVLAQGGELRVASDDPGHVAWALMHLRRHPAFRWCAARADDWRRPPADWVPTRYEAKARGQGRRPAYLRFLRTAARNPGGGPESA